MWRHQHWQFATSVTLPTVRLLQAGGLGKTPEFLLHPVLFARKTLLQLHGDRGHRAAASNQEIFYGDMHGAGLFV